MSAAEKYVKEFDDEFSSTRKFLDLTPDDKLGWKPHEKSMELGRLAWHLADFPQWFQSILGQDTLTITAEEGAKYRDAWVGKKRADILAKFDANRTGARALLAQASDSKLSGNWKMEWDGKVVLDGPREQMIRKVIFNHMIHHRAQLGVYLRLNNIAIPGIYGPSADDKNS